MSASSTHSSASNFIPLTWAGDLLLPLRLILGWTYFSAFWRRLILENKLVMDEPGYLGEKFNHFLPNAFLIQSQIEYFLLNPNLLWWKLVAFTMVEAVVGLALMLGFATRLAGLATSGLAVGILLGAGWLGTTCLDEWQIGILGIGAGLALFFAGGGRWSLDATFHRRGFRLPAKLQWAVEPGYVSSGWFHRTIVPAAFGLSFLALLTNQVFHGGVWGPLHNKSVRPKVEISNAVVENGVLRVGLYRVEGADVYGSFAIALRILDEKGSPVITWTAKDLAALSAEQIRNRYIAKVKPGKNSLVLPLGAKADVTLLHTQLASLPAGTYQVELEDVSGAAWKGSLQIPENI